MMNWRQIEKERGIFKKNYHFEAKPLDNTAKEKN
jgi:hypothetical protein